MIEKYLGSSCEKFIVPIANDVIKADKVEPIFKSVADKVNKIATNIAKAGCVECIVDVAKKAKDKDVCNKKDGDDLKSEIGSCMMPKVMDQMGAAMGLVGKANQACDKSPSKELLMRFLEHTLAELVCFETITLCNKPPFNSIFIFLGQKNGWMEMFTKGNCFHPFGRTQSQYSRKCGQKSRTSCPGHVQGFKLMKLCNTGYCIGKTN